MKNSHQNSSFISTTIDSQFLNPSRNELAFAYENRTKLQKKRPVDLLFPLSGRSYLMAQTFMLNHYEINCIFDAYLVLWSNNPDRDYITINQLKNAYIDLKDELFLSFFDTEEVYYDSFFQFVCFFVFLNPQQIVTYLLSCLQIHSNVIITKSQMLQIIGLFKNVYSQSEINRFCSENKSNCESGEEAYSIKSFIFFLNQSISLQSTIFSVRMTFIHLIFSFKMYTTILKRQKYYTEKPTRILEKQYEPFCEKLKRVLFTHSLPPLYYDYILPKPTEQSVDNLVIAMKQTKGYGYRQPQTQYSSYRTLNSSRRKSSKTRLINTKSSLNNRSVLNSMLSPMKPFRSNNKITPIL